MKRAIVFVLCLNFCLPLRAQQPPPPPPMDGVSDTTTLPPQEPFDENEIKVKGPRKQLAIIIFFGLSGAIIGLSTLSFYGRPQDHLVNIAVGFALGVITGTGFVTYKAATEPQKFYTLNQEHLQSLRVSGLQKPDSSVPLLSYGFQF